MATIPQEFIDLAAELIGDEFVAFTNSATISRLGDFDPVTQKYTSQEQSLPMIRIDFKENAYNGASVLVGDYMLIGEYQKLEFEPRADSDTVSHDGINSNIVSAQVDPAKASIILHVRRS